MPSPPKPPNRLLNLGRIDNRIQLSRPPAQAAMLDSAPALDAEQPRNC